MLLESYQCVEQCQEVGKSVCKILTPQNTNRCLKQALEVSGSQITKVELAPKMGPTS
jgi:hypothetical protein